MVRGRECLARAEPLITATAPLDWPLKVGPRRNPPVWQGLAISLGALVLAVVTRILFLGTESGLGIAPIYFPALLLAGVYAGRWGFVTLAGIIALSIVSPTPVREELAPRFLVLFALSATFTLAV